MSVVKIGNRSEKPFAQIDNRLLNDKRLSWRAKGLLCYLIGKPEDWTIVTEHLVTQGTEGRDAVRTAFQELKELGYASLEVNRTAEGKITGSIWTIHEIPTNREPEKPQPEKPQPEKPDCGKSDTTNTELTNTEDTTNTEPEAVEEFLTAWNNSGFVKCIHLTAKRKQHLKARFKSKPWRENWTKALAIMKISPFCCGQNDRGWIPDIDWFIRSDDAVAKALEGKYGAKEAIAKPSAKLAQIAPAEFDPERLAKFPMKGERV